MKPRLIAAGTLAILVLLFVIQNVQVVEVRFLFWKFETSRAILLLLTFGGGAAIGALLTGLTGWGGSRRA